MVEQTDAGRAEVDAFDAVYMGAAGAASSAPEGVDGVAGVGHNTHIHLSTAEYGRTWDNRTELVGAASLVEAVEAHS